MITINFLISLDASTHNLINLHLFPKDELRLGQFEYYDHYENAKIVWERTGNPFGREFSAVTYYYWINGDGFEAQLVAVWPDEDTPTAEVKVMSITPHTYEAQKAFLNWSEGVAFGRKPPREPLDRLGL